MAFRNLRELRSFLRLRVCKESLKPLGDKRLVLNLKRPVLYLDSAIHQLYILDRISQALSETQCALWIHKDEPP